MRANKTVTLLLAGVLLILAGVFFSADNRASRAYRSMLKHGEMDLQVIDTFINTRETSGPAYYQALNLAAVLDDHYLEQVVELYAGAEILLRAESAERILSLLPSGSVTVNTAAGRLMADAYYGYEDPSQAARLLEYSALRQDKRAAVYLSALFRQFDCPIGAANWAQVANQRDDLAECSQLTIESTELGSNDWNQVLDNQKTLKSAWGADEIPVLQYSADCVLTRQQQSVLFDTE